MSTLGNAVQARYSAQTLIDLTRQKDTDTTTLDSVRLELAVDDVTSAFEVYAGIDLDVTDAKQVMFGVQGVIACLKTWARDSSDAGKSEWDVWTEKMERLGKVTGRDRIVPTSTSTLTPSLENPDGSDSARPAFDDEHFAGLVPGAP